jgi:glycosidase
VSLQRKSEWWRSAVIYEIAPLSFQDTNDDGKGDLKGIESRIDYLSWLGIDAVWLTPFFPSPMLDFGYDITDYCAVDPVFGSLEDFDRLVEILHARNIRLLLDFVPNHTSDKHAWFADSRSSRTSAKRDWYVWADPSPVRPTTGLAASAAARGNGMKRPNNTTTIHSSWSSPISTGEMRKFVPQWRTCCAFGCGGG